MSIRKVVGSSRHQLIRQFLSESIVFSSLAVILALILVELFLPVFNNLVGKELFLFRFYELALSIGTLFGCGAFGVAAGSTQLLSLFPFNRWR